MKPLVSAIVPVYNREDKIESAIKSILDQTYENLEIIVIDDGSTDNTSGQIKKFASKVRYVFQKNSGVSAARNRGIVECSGNIIAFLDSDDQWLPDKIEKQVNYLNVNPEYSSVLCECYYMYEDGLIFGQSNRAIIFKNDINIFKNIIKDPELIPSSFLIEKAVLLDIGLFDVSLRTAEDQDLLLKLAQKHRIGFIEEPLLKYMRENNGLSQLATTYDDTIFVITRFLQGQNDLPRILKRNIICKHYLDASLGKCWLGDYSSMRKYFFNAMSNIRDIESLLLSFKTLIRAIRSLFSKYVKRHWMKNC